jgi:hypothetical protein
MKKSFKSTGPVFVSVKEESNSQRNIWPKLCKVVSPLHDTYKKNIFIQQDSKSAYSFLFMIGRFVTCSQKHIVYSKRGYFTGTLFQVVNGDYSLHLILSMVYYVSLHWHKMIFIFFHLAATMFRQNKKVFVFKT